MYTSYSREVHNTDQSNTKYTEYLRTFDEAADNILAAGRGGGKVRHHQSPLLPLSDNEVKFSKIFTPNESNALKLQLLQKTSSLPVLSNSIDNARGSNSNGVVGDSSNADAEELIVSTNHNNDRSTRRRRSTAGDLVHGNGNAGRKTDSVANILYSTIRHGHDSADETLHTGSDSKVDYDPHEPLPAVDQIALRHELLNNIRAISRATYFEDLYTGKVRRNSESPEEEILRILENPQGAANEAAGVIPSTGANLSRVDRWVKESSEESRAQDAVEDKYAGPEAAKQAINTSSLYHQTVWNEDEARKGANKTSLHHLSDSKKHDSETTEGSDVETASAYMRRNNHHRIKFQHKTPTSTNNVDNSSPVKSYNKNIDKTNYPSGMLASTSQFMKSNYLGSNDLGLDSLGKKRPFSFGYDYPDNLIPLSLSLPNVARSPSYRSPHVALPPSSLTTHSISRPENLNHSVSNIRMKRSTNQDEFKTRHVNNHNEQVRKMVQPAAAARLQHRVPEVPRGIMLGRPERKVHGITRLHDMNQWAVKKVWFYVNGDEHFPRFEYRFRHGKDIRDLDQLLDILTKKIPSLPTGARYIFTMDGYLINSLDEMLNDHSYVVSSIRKFKALKYHGGRGESDGLGEHENNTEPRAFHGRGDNYPAEDAKTGKRKYKSVKNRTHQRLNRRLSASDGNINTTAANNAGVQLPTSYYEKSMSSLNSKSVSDVPKVVAHVIQASTSSPMARQPIRVINGSKPSLQSQVLLNTKTSQPFEDLVRDLALSVRIPKQPIGDRLETLTGRQIRSYSQLRSELKAGQRAFYIYSDEDVGQINLYNSSIRKGNANSNKPAMKSLLGKVNSNSSSDLSYIAQDQHRARKKSQTRRRSRTPSPRGISNQYSPSISPSFR